MTGGEAPYTYQWYADGEAIKGATNSSYNVTSYDLGKELSVAVMDADGNSDLSDETDAVVEKFALSEVLLDNTTPKVGDLLTATAYDAFGEDVSSECTWQWYRVTRMGMTVKIANQTKRTYTVGSIDAEAVLYAVATDVYGIEYTSNESTPNRAEDVSDVRILGISGKQTYSKINDVAILGDELRVDATPNASLTGVDYQWYRGRSKIVGATNPTYTVTKEDIGTKIGVAINIPDTLGYKFLADVTSNANVYSTVAGANMVRGTYAFVELKNEAANDVAIQTASLTNQSPSVGQTTTVRVRFDKNKDGDIEDSGDYLDLNGTDGSVIWYRNEVAPKNIIARGSGYTVLSKDAGSVLIAKVKGTDNSEFNGELKISTDKITKEIATVDVDASEIVEYAKSHGVVGERVTATIKDKARKSVPATGYDLQWYINGTAVNGATSATLQITPAIAADHLVGLTTAPTFKCEVVGKGDYTGSVQNSANGEAPGGTRWTANPATITKVILKNEAGTEITGAKTVSKGETLTVTTTPAAAVNDFDWTWYYGATTASPATLSASASGSSFKLGDGVVSGDKIFVVPTPKAAANQAINWKKADGITNADGTFLVGTAAAGLQGKTIKDAPGTAATNDSVVSALLGIGTASVTIDNGMTGDDKKTFTAPEVGTYVTATTTNTPAGLHYAWTYEETDTPVVGAGDEATHIVTSADLGLTLKCTITLNADGNGYSASQKATVKTGPVLPSSRTFQEVRIYKNDDIANIVDKGTFEAKAGETKLANGTLYHIVVLDSWNQIHKVVTGDASTEYVLLDRDNQKCHRNDNVTFGNGAGAGYTLKAGEVITVMVVPNQIEFSGATIEVPFSSAVS